MTTLNKFLVIDSLCEAGSDNNDDFLGITPDCIWILDGATGITDKRLLPGPSDATWFVQTVSNNLIKHLRNDLPIQDILNQVIDLTRKQFTCNVQKEEFQEIEQPSASFAIARIDNFSIELGNLGDCKIIYRKKDGVVQSFGSSKVKTFDQIVVNEIIRLKEMGYYNYEDIWAEIKKIICNNRKLKNTEDGYWILDLTHQGIPHLQTKTLSVYEIENLLLVSDGLYRLVDTYNLYDDEALINIANKVGLSQLYYELRQIEKDDLDCGLYPRIKVRDDSSGLLVSLV